MTKLIRNAAVNSTIQTEPPHLSLVTSAERQFHMPEQGVDPIAFLQAITASLELDTVMATLNAFLADLVEHTGWEYRRSDAAEIMKGGKPDRNRLEYLLTLNGVEMGTLKLMRGRRFSEDEQVRIEGLLGLAAPAIQNALRFFKVSQQLERDPLTGLGNRRALNLQGAQWLADSVRHHQPISMLVMDLDRFKAVNDTYGHPVGDRLLCRVAETLMHVTRTADLCVRMGGDEFVVLLPWTDLADALECAERIRHALSEQPIETSGGEQVAASVSIGVATLRKDMDLDKLYQQADEALYAAKRAGSNRVLAGSSTAECRRREPLGTTH
ncbi:GGDEF domain-containing protein [Thiocystis violacea]|uniref:GGDEF domain-containing protein n=1 Tax=Thiocystis violacea TaxID=13725 RepID=UPI001A913674|nr:GGDEF domain-containing protein [Thiocystis violacea]